MVDAPRLAMRGIRKSFGGVEVLHGVDIDVDAGEAHALLGENGAGKSTLMKVLSGVYTADAGQILIDGQERAIRTTRAADEAGIAIIHQELSYVPRLSVAENLLLGHLPHNPGGVVRWGALRAEARRALRDFGSPIDVRAAMGDLPLGQRQIVEIVRAARRRARIIVMDEPTASLTQAEVRQLFALIRALKEQQVSLIYISHHLEEVFAMADRVTVLRDGRRVATRAVGETTRQELIYDMVGRDVADLYRQDGGGEQGQGQERDASPAAAPLLEVSHVTIGDRVRDVSFVLQRGEALGLYGLIGAGQETVARSLFGLVQPTAGHITIEGRRYQAATPGHAIRAGIGFVPPDRKVEGLVLPLSVKSNVTLPLLDQVSRGGVLRGRAETRLARDVVRAVNVRAASLAQQVMFLSGGNQQKVVLGRWLKRDVKVLLLNEPTRGVDVGARAEIYAAIRALAASGAGILLVSSDLPEVLAMTDRVAIMVRGRLVTVVDSRRSSQQEILQYATVGRGDDDGT